MKLTSGPNPNGRARAFFSLLLAVTWMSVVTAGAQTASVTPDDRVLLPDTIQPVSSEHRDLAAARAGSPRPALARALNPPETTVPMNLEVVLKTRHYLELQQRVAAGETITAAEMAERYLPRQSDYDAVSRWLSAQGLAVRTTGAARAMVMVSGSPAQLERALGAKFARVIDRGAEYTAAVTPPALPRELAALVANIHGLQPFLQPHKFAASPLDVGTSGPPYLVSQILRAYDGNFTNLTGAGQQIGIVIDTVPHDSDLTAFWNANGVNQSLSNIITVNVRGGTLPEPSGEETLDVSWASGIAPGAQVVIYACGNLNNVNESYSQILDDLQSGARPNLHQISMSYAAGEVTDETSSDMDSTTQMFTSMTAYGVTLFAGSGDHGAYGGSDNGSTIQVDYPASSPSVVGVGGTSLTLDLSGEVASETVWMTVGKSAGSSGGGISSVFARPKWQVGSTVPAGTMRLVPDVALDADPNTGAYVVLKGEEREYGGTSWSSPTWAGLCALFNEARAQQGLSPLGLANTKFYPLLGTANFRDITSGGNGVYNAAVGYDLVTGIGVPDVNMLIFGLTNSAAPVAPAITSALTASGQVGEAFTYQITASGSPTSFAAFGLPSGLSVTSAGVISGRPTVAGTFPVTLKATNSSATATATLTLDLATAVVRPVVTITANVPSVVVGSGQSGQFDIKRTSTNTKQGLTVTYTVHGSAEPGVDFARLNGTKKIPAGQTAVHLEVVPLPTADLARAATATVAVTLDEPADGAYRVGSESTAKVKIIAKK